MVGCGRSAPVEDRVGAAIVGEFHRNLLKWGLGSRPPHEIVLFFGVEVQRVLEVVIGGRRREFDVVDWGVLLPQTLPFGDAPHGERG